MGLLTPTYEEESLGRLFLSPDKDNRNLAIEIYKAGKFHPKRIALYIKEHCLIWHCNDYDKVAKEFTLEKTLYGRRVTVLIPFCKFVDSDGRLAEMALFENIELYRCNSSIRHHTNSNTIMRILGFFDYTYTGSQPNFPVNDYKKWFTRLVNEVVGYKKKAIYEYWLTKLKELKGK